MAAITPSTIPIDNVAFLMNTISYALLVKEFLRRSSAGADYGSTSSTLIAG
jgi:hypothetical protein